jgi:hypothetical protein
MYRFTMVVVVLAALFQMNPGAAGEPKDRKAALKKAVESADLILVGKVTKTGLVAASSFDVGLIEASRVLKGDRKLKSAHFRFSGRVTPPYARVGVNGVWILTEATKPGWRSVLSFQPLTEEETVKALLKEEKKRNDEKK